MLDYYCYVYRAVFATLILVIGRPKIICLGTGTGVLEGSSVYNIYYA